MVMLFSRRQRTPRFSEPRDVATAYLDVSAGLLRIEYEINPWMSRQRQSDQPTANRQWQALKKLLEDAGTRISLLAPVQGLPDLVFTANAALIFRDQAIMAQFRHPERQGEVTYDEAWLKEAGYRIAHVPADIHFEGAGDALFCGETLVAGYRLRSHARGHQQIGEMLNCRVIPVELVDPYYYHLDTCFCPLATGKALYFPPAFDQYGRDALAGRRRGTDRSRRRRAQRFACNAVVVGRTVVTNTGCPLLHAALRKRGFEPRETPLDEFVSRWQAPSA